MCTIIPAPIVIVIISIIALLLTRMNKPITAFGERTGSKTFIFVAVVTIVTGFSQRRLA